MKTWAKYEGLATIALLVIVAPFFVWQYAVNDTVRQWRGTTKIRRQIAELQSSQVFRVERHETLSSDREMLLSGLMVAEVLPVIENEGLQIDHFAPYITSDTESIRLTTGQLSVRGGFIGIVKLLDAIERELPECKIIAVHYRTTDPRSRSAVRTLSCAIYLQQITLANPADR